MLENLPFYFYIWIFFFGSTIASAIECASYRIAHNQKWTSGRSRCSNCGKILSPVELIPVFSCIFLRAKCSSCGYYFGWSHAVIEACAGLIAVITLKTSVSIRVLIANILLEVTLYAVIRILYSACFVKENLTKIK